MFGGSGSWAGAWWAGWSDRVACCCLLSYLQFVHPPRPSSLLPSIALTCPREGRAHRSASNMNSGSRDSMNSCWWMRHLQKYCSPSCVCSHRNIPKKNAALSALRTVTPLRELSEFSGRGGVTCVHCSAARASTGEAMNPRMRWVFDVLPPRAECPSGWGHTYPRLASSRDTCLPAGPPPPPRGVDSH